MRKSLIAAAALALAVAGCGTGQSAPSAPSGKSDSYKAGYASGSPNGNAYGKASMGVGMTSGNNNRDVCYLDYLDATGNQVHPWNQSDYIEGCMQALQDHPPTKNPLLTP